MLLDEIVARQQQANVVLFSDVPLQAQNPDVGIFVEKSFNRRESVGILSLFFGEISWSIIARQQEPEGVSSALARKFDGDVRIHNRARVHCLDRRAKDIDAFE